MTRTKRPTPARSKPPASSAAAKSQVNKRGWWTRFRESPLGVQILAGVATASLLGAGAAAAPQVIDSAALADKVRAITRGDGDLRSTVSFIDGGYDLVLPPGSRLTTEQRQTMQHWSLPAAAESGTESSVETLAAQLRAGGAADPNVLTLRITVEGRRNQKIKIDSIEAVDVVRRPRFDDVMVLIEPQGPNNTIPMMFDLDEIHPIARTAEPVKSTDPPKPTEKDGVRPGAPFFQKTQLTLGDAEEEAIVIQAVTTRTAVSFRVRISYRIGGEQRKLTVDNAGKPFAVTPVNCTDASILGGAQPRDGHAAYREIWQMRGDMSGADPVPDPAHYAIGFPYC